MIFRFPLFGQSFSQSPGRASCKLFVMALISSAVFSCGVLEPAPVPAATSVPAPTVVPLITASGRLVNTNLEVNGSASEEVSNVDVQVQSTTADMGVERIFQTDRCNELSRGGFIWFTDEVVLDDWMTPLLPDEAKRIRSKIDFSKQGALLLDYGTAGSKGAGASVVGDKLEVKGQNGIVKIKQFKAPKSKKTVQVVTHPCSMFVMPRTGYSTLVILSDMDDELTSFENK